MGDLSGALQRGELVRNAFDPKRTGHVDHVLPSGSVLVDWNCPRPHGRRTYINLARLEVKRDGAWERAVRQDNEEEVSRG